MVTHRLAAAIIAVSLGLRGLSLPAGARQLGTAEVPPIDVARIDRYLAAEVRRHGLPGMAVGLVEGDRVVHLGSFGHGLTPRTPMVLASVSKPLTATAVMQLVDEGRVSLNAPVTTYIPEFRVADERASAEITVRHLLNHTSGLPPSSCEIEAATIEQYVHHLRSVRLGHPVGSRHDYCSGNYTVLGLVVQRGSGMSYARCSVRTGSRCSASFRTSRAPS